MESTESPELMYEEGDALAEGTIETTSSRKTSANPAEPIKKTRLFSLANSTATTAVTRSESTQLDLPASPFHSSQNLDYSNLFFDSDHPSRRFRPEVYEEEDPADPYYSPPSTFMLSEFPNVMEGQEQTSSAVTSSEAQVRDAYLSIFYNTNI